MNGSRAGMVRRRAPRIITQYIHADVIRMLRAYAMPIAPAQNNNELASNAYIGLGPGDLLQTNHILNVRAGTTLSSPAFDMT